MDDNNRPFHSSSIRNSALRRGNDDDAGDVENIIESINEEQRNNSNNNDLPADELNKKQKRRKKKTEIATGSLNNNPANNNNDADSATPVRRRRSSRNKHNEVETIPNDDHVNENNNKDVGDNTMAAPQVEMPMSNNKEGQHFVDSILKGPLIKKRMQFVDKDFQIATEASIYTYTTNKPVRAIEGVAKSMQWNINLLQEYAKYYREVEDINKAEHCTRQAEHLKAQVQKLTDAFNNRYLPISLAEEGIFTEDKPFMFANPTTISIVEQRLLRQPNSLDRFYDENGQVISLPDPCKQIFRRLDASGDEDFYFPTTADGNIIELKRTRTVSDARLTSSAKEEKFYQLDIDLRELRFLIHPLMTEEEFYCAQLCKFYEQYQEKKRMNLTSFYSEKLKALQNTLAQTKQKSTAFTSQEYLMTGTVSRLPSLRKDKYGNEQESAIMQQIKNLLYEIRDTRQALEDEESFEFQLLKDIIEMWRRVSAIRQESPFISSPVTVTFSEIPGLSYEEDMQRMEEEIRMEISELQLENEADYVLEMIEYRRLTEKDSSASMSIAATGALSPNKGLFASGPLSLLSSPGASVATSVAAHKPKKRQVDEREERRNIMARWKTFKRKPGSAIIVPHLSKNYDIVKETPHCPQYEVNRRNKVANTEYYVKLLVNKKVVAKTSTERLNQLHFTLHFREIIHVRLLKWPESLCLQLYESKSGVAFRDELVSTMYISAPGLDAMATTEGASGSISKDIQYLFTSDMSFLPLWIRETKPNPRSATGGRTKYRCPPYFLKEQAMRAEEEARAKEEGTITANTAPQHETLFEIAGYHTTGTLGVCAYWASLEEGQPPQAPPNPNPSGKDFEINAPTARDLLNMQKIKNWMKGRNIDPNDPRNTGLLSMLETIDHANLTRKGFFLSEQDDDILFVDKETYQESRRLTFLRMRDQKIVRFNKPVSLDEKLISDEMLMGPKARRRRLGSAALATTGGEEGELQWNEEAEPYDEDDEEEIATGADGRQIRVSEYIRKVRRAMAALQAKRMQRQKQNNITLASIIKNEPPIPDFSGVFSWIASFFAPDRPLRPARRAISTGPRNKEITTVESFLEALKSTPGGKCRIYVQVVRAYNVPLRRADMDDGAGFRQYRSVRMKQQGNKRVQSRLAMSRSVGKSRTGALGPESSDDATSEHSGTGAMGDGSDVVSPSIREEDAELAEAEAQKLKQDSVCSFATVSFQNNHERTSSIEGASPQFNEPIVLEFEPPGGDFSPDNLAVVEDNIYFDLFDELTIENIRDDRLVNIRNERTEVRWLGSLAIPFSTLYMNGKIEGIFRLKTPIFNLGYEYNPQGSTDLELFMRIDPPLPKPDASEDFVSSGETPELYSYARWWEDSIKGKSHCKDREIMALAPNIEGRATLVTRYICKQAPPRELTTLGQVVRFVSLIPFIEDSAAFKGRTNVWIDSQEFLEIGAGDWEEHAILLCNYLLYLGKKAWVVLGSGVPEGDTAYVLTREEEDEAASDVATAAASATNMQRQASQKRFKYTLWNAATGKSYPSTDPFCPLKDVGTVFNAENIWANVQKEGLPSKISWNFEEEWNWRPFFGRTSPLRQEEINIETIQVEKLQYSQTPALYATKIQKEIDNAIKLEFSRWRDEEGFNWHYGAAGVLRQLSKSFEQYKRGDRELSEADHNEKMRQILSSFELNGFPLNFTYTSVEPILKEVFNTDIHNNDEPGVKFALDVYVEPYPNKILSVWVYIAALISKR